MASLLPLVFITGLMHTHAKVRVSAAEEPVQMNEATPCGCRKDWDTCASVGPLFKDQIRPNTTWAKEEGLQREHKNIS